MHYILFYDTCDDYVARRQPYRAEHLKLATDARECGDLVMAGAFAEPADGAALVFKSEESARAFAGADPYVANGLVPRWWVRKWNVVV